MTETIELPILKKSTHKAEVVKVVRETHPNGDKLFVVHVYGYTVCINKKDWEGIELGVYVVPDSVVDTTRPEFSFLAERDTTDNKYRVRVHKFRGVMSQGLLVPAPPGAKLGDDVAEQLGITHYEPPKDLTMGGDNEKAPPGIRPNYDIDSWHRYRHLFTEGEEVVVTEKIEGCFKNDTRIRMADGNSKRINCINVGDEIIGVDDNGQITNSVVTQTYNNGKTKQWLRVTGTRNGAGRGNSYFRLFCTPEHKFWNNEISEYIRADRLSTGSSVSMIRSELSITPLQYQVVLGKLLGDGCLFVHKYTAHLSFGHSVKDSEYVNWTVKALGELGTSYRRQQTTGHGGQRIDTHTISTSYLKTYFADFYTSDRVKIIPEWVVDKLTPLAIAFWYMDDGSLVTCSGQEDRAVFATCGFTEKDCDILIRGLHKFDIHAQCHVYNGYPNITLKADEAEKLFLLVAPYIPKHMQRKLPNRYRGHAGWLPDSKSVYKPVLVSQTISSVEIANNVMSPRYDLETTTHNYFANNVLVHNCNSRFTYTNDRMYCGSHYNWKKEDKASLWWKALARHPEVEEFCKTNPSVTVYGEAYGNVGGFPYDVTPGQVGIRVFDILAADGITWLSSQDARKLVEKLPWVPIKFTGPYKEDLIVPMAEEDSDLGEHMSEGVVVRPIVERCSMELGRVILKIKGNRYLEKSGKKKK